MALLVKKLPASVEDVRDAGLFPGSGRLPLEEDVQPTPVLLPGESHDRRSLVGCSP